MDARDILRQMVDASGKSQRLISTEIGRHPTYVASLLHGESYPQVDTFASIARACGCEVVVRLPTTVLEVDGWQVEAQREARLD